MTKDTLQDAGNAFYQAFKARIEPALNAALCSMADLFDPQRRENGLPMADRVPVTEETLALARALAYQIATAREETGITPSDLHYAPYDSWLVRLAPTDTAKRLTTATTLTVIQYAEALYPGDEAKQAAVIAEPLLAQKWPVVRQRLGLPQTPDEQAKLEEANQAFWDLGCFAGGDSGIADVTPAQVATALARTKHPEATSLAQLILAGAVPLAERPIVLAEKLEAVPREALMLTDEDVERARMCLLAADPEFRQFARVDYLNWAGTQLDLAEQASNSTSDINTRAVATKVTPSEALQLAKEYRVHEWLLRWSLPAVATFVAVERWLEQKRKPPALPMLVHKPVVELLAVSRRAALDEEYSGQRRITLPSDVVVTVRQDLIEKAFTRGSTGWEKASKQVERGIHRIGSLLGHKAIRHLVRTGHQQALARHPDPRLLTYEGGKDGFGEALGASKKEKGELGDILEAMHHVEFPLPGQEPTRLLIRSLFHAKGQRRARLELVLGTMLLPNYVHELQELGFKGPDVRLVPLLDEPPMIGRPNEHAAQATLSMLVVAHFRDNARALVEHEGVPLPPDLLRRMADKAGLPSAFNLQRMLDAWLAGDDRRPPFLRRTALGLYTLGESYAADLAFILAGGQKELDSSHHGKASVVKRNRAAAKGRK